MVAAALLALVVAGPPVAAPPTFEAEQLQAPRVRAAFGRAEPRLRALFDAAGVPYPPRAIFLRGFKRERELELWAKGVVGRYVLVRRYPVCAASGDLGPKRREGDAQVPEGFYRVVHFNPGSSFHLSLGLDYPNASDQRLGAALPGGAIYVHGACESAGCLALGDDAIEEVYVAAVLARGAGQADIPVHLFPARLDPAGVRVLELLRGGDAALLAFWRNLRDGYERFERDGRPPEVDVDPLGRYLFR